MRLEVTYMEIEVGTISWQDFYRYMVQAVVPRPIGWVSTLAEDGIANLAPFSFFNAICGNPPHLLWCAARRGRSSATKDSFANVVQSGEFVVNIVTYELGEKMNLTAADVDPAIDEFEVAGLTKAPSMTVKPPRVAESPIHFECKLTQIVDVSTEPGGASVVIGRIQHLHVDDTVLTDGLIDIHKLDPLARLGGNSYARIVDTFNMIRPMVIK